MPIFFPFEESSDSPVESAVLSKHAGDETARFKLHWLSAFTTRSVWYDTYSPSFTVYFISKEAEIFYVQA